MLGTSSGGSTWKHQLDVQRKKQPGFVFMFLFPAEAKETWWARVFRMSHWGADDHLPPRMSCAGMTCQPQGCSPLKLKRLMVIPQLSSCTLPCHPATSNYYVFTEHKRSRVILGCSSFPQSALRLKETTIDLLKHWFSGTGGKTLCQRGR